MAGKPAGRKHFSVTFGKEVQLKLKEKKEEVMRDCKVCARTVDRWIGAGAAPATCRLTLIKTLNVRGDQISEATKGAIVSGDRSKKNRHLKGDYNFAPLIKAIAEVQCETVTYADMIFLTMMQAELPNPVSPSLIVEILQNRHQEK